MSGKLDQSLDAIMSDRKTTNPKRGGKSGRPTRSAATRTKAAVAAPVGGVQKNTRAPKGAPKAPAVTAPARGDSKIMVSNLPEDISEGTLKEFFAKAIGNCRKVLLSYGPNGRSRGEATVTFNTATGAAEAQKQYHGVKVDNRAMKIEIVGGTVAAAKPLQERIAKPKSAAKDATKGSTKGATAKANGKAATANNAAAATTTTETGKGRATKKKSGRAGRAKAKTAEELDAEMQDYFGGGEANGVAATTVVTTNGAQPAAAVVNGGDTGMEDEVL